LWSAAVSTVLVIYLLAANCDTEVGQTNNFLVAIAVGVSIRILKGKNLILSSKGKRVSAVNFFK
jgi:hypothetical protein